MSLFALLLACSSAPPPAPAPEPEPVPQPAPEPGPVRRVAVPGALSTRPLEGMPGVTGHVTQVAIDGKTSPITLTPLAAAGQEIDGVVYLSFDYGGQMPTPGDMVEVEIQDATAYDLTGVVVPTEPLNLESASLDLSMR